MTTPDSADYVPLRSAVVQALVWSFDHDKSMGNIADTFIRHLGHGGYVIVPKEGANEQVTAVCTGLTATWCCRFCGQHTALPHSTRSEA